MLPKAVLYRANKNADSGRAGVWPAVCFGGAGGVSPVRLTQERGGSPVYRVLIVDDHAAVREGVRRVLSEQLHPDAQGEASSADEAIEMVRREQWDVIVLDVHMPGKSGIEVLKAVKQTSPDLPVVMLSVYPPDQMASRLLAAGAAAYVSKSSAADELVNTIRQVVARKESRGDDPRPADNCAADDALTAWHL